MVNFSYIDEVVGTQYFLIYGAGSGETTEVDKINLLLNAFANLSLISLSSSVSPRHSQNAFDAPMRLFFVAASLCPFSLREQSLDTWLHPPCVQQYRSICLRKKLALSGVLRMRDLPPFLSPLPPKPLRSPELPWRSLEISRSRRSISNCTESCTAAFTAGSGGGISFVGGLLSADSSYTMAIICEPCNCKSVPRQSASILA